MLTPPTGRGTSGAVVEVDARDGVSIMVTGGAVEVVSELSGVVVKLCRGPGRASAMTEDAVTKDERTKWALGLKRTFLKNETSLRRNMIDGTASTTITRTTTIKGMKRAKDADPCAALGLAVEVLAAALATGAGVSGSEKESRGTERTRSEASNTVRPFAIREE